MPEPELICPRSICSRANRAWCASRPFCDGARLLRRHHISRAALGMLARSAIPCCRTARSQTAVHSNPLTARRYVDFAIRDIAQQFDNLGVNRDEVEVKLFGGGDVLISTRNASNGRHHECGDRATRAQRRRI